MVTTKFKTKVPKVDPAKLQKFLNAGQDLLTAIDIIPKKLNAKYNPRVKFDLELMGENAVRAFYDSYSPYIYSRQEGLLSAFKVTANDDEWKIEVGAEFMTGHYDAGTEYVYINSFEKGWHGGAINGPDHPEPGTPWWRTPFPELTYWKSPAARGPSPLEELIAADPDGYIDQKIQEYIEEKEMLRKPFVDAFFAALNDL